MLFSFPNRTILRSKEVECFGCNHGEWQEVFWHETLDCTDYDKTYDAYIVYPALAVAVATFFILGSERRSKWIMPYIALCTYATISALAFIVTAATICASARSILACVYTFIVIPFNTIIVLLVMIGETEFDTLRGFYMVGFPIIFISLWLT